MFITEDEGFWSLELGIVLTNIATVHRRRGTAPRPPLAIAAAAKRGRVRRRVPWPTAGQPVFGGVEDGRSEEDGGPRRRGCDDPLLRVRVMALLYANPEAPCSTPQVARVFGLRETDVRSARPPSARRVGRALLAPFGHWLVTLQRAGLVPAWPDELEAPSEGPSSPSARRRHRPGHLRPLGGPGRR
jgi:hypothetical protein